MLGKYINHCEDSLTAAVFTHLLHLPSEVFWRILCNSCCYTDDLPQNLGEPISVEFWPNWDPKGTDNTNRVIPDLFIRFVSFDLIIEAKRWDGADMQNPDQWEKEVIAYANQYGSDDILVNMIALGGIRGTRDEAVVFNGEAALSICVKWERVLAETKQMKKELEAFKYPSSHTQACVRILTHLIDLFAWHGFSTGQWFKDFHFDKHRLSSSVNSCLGLFQICRK